jgi:hypothetical protein
VEIVRSAGLGAGAGKSLAAEGLGADDGADLVAVHIEIADPDLAPHLLDGPLDAGVEAERQAEAGGVQGLADLADTVAGKTQDMEDGAEDLALQGRERSQLIGRRSNESAI